MNNRDRFDKFTERARKVLQFAQEEAQRLDNNYIGVEHLWLGIMRESEGVGAKVLEKQGVNLQKMRDAVVAMHSGSKQPTIEGHLGLTDKGKKAIEQAVAEARSLNHHYIGTEHLLLGLVRQADKATQEIFDTLEVKLDDISDQTMKILSQAGATRSFSQVGTTQQSTPESQTQSSTRNKFNRFSPKSRKVLSLAQEEAQRFQHNYIGTEHLLLGLLRQTDGMASQVLSGLGMELNNARGALEQVSGRGDRIVLGEMHMLPSAQRLIDLAIQEADLLGSEIIETEHLLLGMMRVGDDIVIAMLERLGISSAEVSILTIHRLREDIARKAERIQMNRVEATRQQQAQAMVESLNLPAPSEEDEAAATRLIQRLNEQGYGTDTFNEEAKRVLVYATQEAQRFQHNYIGTEHLLLGLMHIDESIATSVLVNLGINLTKLRSSVEFIIGRGDRLVLGEIGLTPRAKKVVALAADEAHLLQHDYIGAEHLLLALIREGEGIAAGVLESLGVKLPAVRKQVIEEIERDQKHGQEG